jgi:anaerobic magnesium-protoporphyrin IX monomethyl ester cyclase
MDIFHDWHERALPRIGRAEKITMKKTKVLFLQEKWEDNLGVLWIAALLRQKDFQTEIVVEQRHIYERIEKTPPDIIGFSCYTGGQQWIFGSIEKARKAGFKGLVIVGGPHATFFPELIAHPFVDVVCRGEGEYAMLDLANAIEEGKDPSSIGNLSFKKNGSVVHNPLRPLVENLDALPFPDRSYYEKYPFLASNPYKTFITSRGCPYQCTFCFNHVLHRLYGKTSHYIRRRSVDNVMRELTEVKTRWGINEVRFSDDHFALDVKWLEEFTSRYKKEISKPYTINARADILTEDKIIQLKESGCRLVCFGVETGREDIRTRLLKKAIHDEHLLNASILLKKYKLAFLTSNIIGLPDETPADAWTTIKLNQRMGTDLPWYSMMQYYPGTEIYDLAKSKGILAQNYTVDSVGSYFENTYINQPHMEELRNIHSFSILVTWFPLLMPLFKLLAGHYRSNAVFLAIFKISYLFLTFKRANFTIIRTLRWWNYYLKSM